LRIQVGVKAAIVTQTLLSISLSNHLQHLILFHTTNTIFT